MIELDEVKRHLRVLHNHDDVDIEQLILAAISAFETLTNRQLIAANQPLPDPVGKTLLLTPAIKQGALLLIGHWYVNRESTITGVSAQELPFATHALWLPHRWVNV